MKFLDIIGRILGMLPGPFQGLFKGLGELFDKLGPKADPVIQQGEDLSKHVATNPQMAIDWCKVMYPDLMSLLTMWPKLPCLIYVAHNIQADQGVDWHTAITAAQLGYNEVKQG